MRKPNGKRRTSRAPPRRRAKSQPDKGHVADLHARCEAASALAESGRHDEAASEFAALEKVVTNPRLKALVNNDLGALAAVRGDRAAARSAFTRSLALDPACEPARFNLALLDADASLEGKPNDLEATLAATAKCRGHAPRRIALVSFLFSFPSSGGGIVHTVELARFLGAAGYDVRHFYASYEPWGIGHVATELGFASEPVRFVESTWNVVSIQRSFRAAVAPFKPDAVIITDTWNMKPHLAEAMHGFPTFLRFQALECVCPLNNVRLLVERDGSFHQCTGHQLSDPARCRSCLAERGPQSGRLHQVERVLADVDSRGYHERLLRALHDCAGVLVLNSATHGLLRPFAEKVHVIPWGMDPRRFPNPPSVSPDRGKTKTIFQAGIVTEYMKGFSVLHAACLELWKKRQDFRLVATGDPAGRQDAFTEFTGWKTQEELTDLYSAADIVVVPTVAQEGLSRTSVEAMAAGKPVVASRIGGLPSTVSDGDTGFLFEPGNVDELADRLARLLDDAQLCSRLGRSGRARFERDFTWPIVIDRYYRPILGEPNSEPGRAPSVGPNLSNSVAPIAETVCDGTVGCIIAVQNRSQAILERTFQSYDAQTQRAVDRVLLDFGSTAEFGRVYAELCRRYGWRLVRAETTERWHLSAAFNLAASALGPHIDVLLKSDADVLLGPTVVETAGHIGRRGFCQFQYFTTPPEVQYPAQVNEEGVRYVFRQCTRLWPSAGQGLFACPLSWFREVGGFDLNYRDWGYEDHDLRWRAEQALGAFEVSFQMALLIHQWHAPSVDPQLAEQNRGLFERSRQSSGVVRNGGRLNPKNVTMRTIVDAEPKSFMPLPVVTRQEIGDRVVFATRSTQDELFRLSGQFLNFEQIHEQGFHLGERFQLANTDAVGYFRDILQLEGDWVVNLDEDVFLLDPVGLIRVLNTMRHGGYAACGMPDGGIVAIRRHNPLALNACFTVFDLRRMRAVVAGWESVLQQRHRPDLERFAPSFARRTPFTFDDSEPYYAIFFAILTAGERILYLDAEEGLDSIATIIKAPDHRPLVLHGCCARDGRTDVAIKRQYQDLWSYARDLYVHPKRVLVREFRAATTPVGHTAGKAQR